MVAGAAHSCSWPDSTQLTKMKSDSTNAAAGSTHHSWTAGHTDPSADSTRPSGGVA